MKGPYLLKSTKRSSLLVLNESFSDGGHVEADLDEGRVVQDLSAVEHKGRFLHRRVQLLKIEIPAKKLKKLDFC